MVFSSSQARGAVCSTSSCSPDHKTCCAVLHEEGWYSRCCFIVTQRFYSNLRDKLHILPLVSSPEQSDAQLSGVQKALEGQSDDDSFHLSFVLPLVSRSCRVCHLHNLDVSGTNNVPFNDSETHKQFNL